MKRFASLLLCLILVVTCFAACGKGKKYDRENLIYGTEEFVELCDVSQLEFKTSDFQSTLDAVVKDYLKNAANAETVENGDITIINYAGSVDGVAFSGGTAQNQELIIGSGKFIKGFEEQLIGVKVGETVTITVTFPEDYNDSTDLETGKKVIKLANQKAQFKVTINEITRPFDEANDEFLDLAGFENIDEFNEHTKKVALESVISSYINENTKVLDYPDEDQGTPYTYFKNYYTSYAQQNGATFEDFLTYNNLTEESFKQTLLKDVIIMYAAFDELGLVLEDNAVDTKISELATQFSVTTEEITERYTRAYVESQLVIEKVMTTLVEKATITE